MSTILNTEGSRLKVPRAENGAMRCAVVTARWNREITHALRDGAVGVLRDAGVDFDRITLIDVPGTVELVNAAAFCLDKGYDAVIVIGTVIRGDTPHFDYVCQIVAQGTAELNARGGAPVIFGVLTVDNLKQARERAGGVLGNKGAEAAVAAVEMANLHYRLGR